MALDLHYLPQGWFVEGWSLRLASTTHHCHSLLHHGGVVLQLLQHLGVHSGNVWHTTGHTWHLGLLLRLLGLLYGILLHVLFENRVRTLHQIVLHRGEHRCKTLTHRRSKERLWQIYNVFRDPLANENLGALICEIVAVMGHYVVCGLGEARLQVTEQLCEEIFRDLRSSQHNLLCWLTERGLTRLIITNSTTKVELLAVDDNTSMPNAIDLSANHLLAEVLCHAVRQVIDI